MGVGWGALGAWGGRKLPNPAWVPKGFLEGHLDPDGKLGGQERRMFQTDGMAWVDGYFPSRK